MRSQFNDRGGRRDDRNRDMMDQDTGSRDFGSQAYGSRDDDRTRGDWDRPERYDSDRRDSDRRDFDRSDYRSQDFDRSSSGRQSGQGAQGSFGYNDRNRDMSQGSGGRGWETNQRSWGSEGSQGFGSQGAQGYGMYGSGRDSGQSYSGRDSGQSFSGRESGSGYGGNYDTSSSRYGSYDVGSQRGYNRTSSNDRSSMFGSNKDDRSGHHDKSFMEELGEKVGRFFGVGPKGYRRSDDRIREDVSEALYAHPEIDASDIEVDVRDGIVTLSGTVDSRRIKRLAEDAVEHLSGVSDVTNNLRVRPQATDGTTSSGFGMGSSTSSSSTDTSDTTSTTSNRSLQ